MQRAWVRAQGSATFLWLIFSNRYSLRHRGTWLICATLREFTVTCNLSGDQLVKNNLFTKMERYNKYQTKQLYTHACTRILYTCTHNSWWLVHGWMTATEYTFRTYEYSLHELHMARYQVSSYSYTITITIGRAVVKLVRHHTDMACRCTMSIASSK